MTTADPIICQYIDCQKLAECRYSPMNLYLCEEHRKVLNAEITRLWASRTKPGQAWLREDAKAEEAHNVY